MLLKCKDARSVIVGITGVNYTANGKMVVGGCMDGSLQVWSTTRNHHRP